MHASHLLPSINPTPISPSNHHLNSSLSPFKMDSDSPMSDANNQIILFDKIHEEQESLSIEQGLSSEGEAPAVEEEEEEMEMENDNYQLMIIRDEEREYGCRYCRKKFSNKQALGGHQNAHKVERAMEKNEEESGIGFYSRYSPYHGRMSVPVSAAAPLLSNYHHRQPEFLHRPSLYNWNFTSQQMVGGRVVPYNPRPLPHGYTGCLYHPWSSAPRLPEFTVASPYTLPLHIRLPDFGPGSSNTFRSASDQGFPPGFRIRPAPPVNLRNVPDVEHDESGLDLSLRLGYDDV